MDLVQEQKRLSALLDGARAHAKDMNLRAVQVSIEIAKEKTQYFEKLALGGGATIALVVSFVGAHSGRLEPPWLLRSSLVILVLAMASAMLRNWLYPFYLFSVHIRQDLSAKQNRERAKRNYLVVFPAIDFDDGKPINVPEYLKGFDEDDKTLTRNIEKVQKREDRSFAAVKHIEWAALALVVIGMCMLIALAWKNF